jgi:hypothetical protein
LLGKQAAKDFDSQPSNTQASSISVKLIISNDSRRNNNLSSSRNQVLMGRCVVHNPRFTQSEDWTRESAVMDQIYGNGFVNLAAAGARNVSEGILTAASDTFGSYAIPLTVHDLRDLRKYPMSGSIATLRFYPYDIDDKQPLAKRAWAFQEYTMSNRILSYQKEQLVWECKTGKQYMNGPVNVQLQQTEPGSNVSSNTRNEL